MSRRILTMLAALVALLTLVAPALASDPVTDGLAWLKTQQQPDGGFSSGFGAGSDVGTTCDAVLAIAAGGQDASTWRASDGDSPLEYLHAQVAAGTVNEPGARAKTVLALLATGQEPTAFAGHDLVAELEAACDPSTGSYGGTVFGQTLAMLALVNAGQPVPEGAIQYLLDNQATDGAWTFFGGTEAGTGDTNTTAMAVQALLATGTSDGLAEGVAYLRRVQNEDGGFPYQKPSEYGTDTDANSTALVLQALLALEEPLEEWARAGIDPLVALAALQDSETGGFLWQTGDSSPNVLATAQAIPAMAGYTFVNLPHAEVTQAPGDAAAEHGAVLPTSGGTTLPAAGLVLMGISALSAGVALRRR
jgi:prenyltransferase beta subunit